MKYKDPTEFTVLLAKAKAQYEAMTPTEQKAMREAQRRSWVTGELMLEHDDMTKEQANKLYDDALERK